MVEVVAGKMSWVRLAGSAIAPTHLFGFAEGQNRMGEILVCPPCSSRRSLNVAPLFSHSLFFLYAHLPSSSGLAKWTIE
jgi:hypothetical protein